MVGVGAEYVFRPVRVKVDISPDQPPVGRLGGSQVSSQGGAGVLHGALQQGTHCNWCLLEVLVSFGVFSIVWHLGKFC